MINNPPDEPLDHFGRRAFTPTARLGQQHRNRLPHHRPERRSQLRLRQQPRRRRPLPGLTMRLQPSPLGVNQHILSRNHPCRQILPLTSTPQHHRHGPRHQQPTHGFPPLRCAITPISPARPPHLTTSVKRREIKKAATPPALSHPGTPAPSHRRPVVVATQRQSSSVGDVATRVGPSTRTPSR